MPAYLYMDVICGKRGPTTPVSGRGTENGGRQRSLAAAVRETEAGNARWRPRPAGPHSLSHKKTARSGYLGAASLYSVVMSFSVDLPSAYLFHVSSKRRTFSSRNASRRMMSIISLEW